MSTYIWISSLLVIGVIIYSIYYTLVVAKAQKDVKGEYSGPIDEKVQKHPYLRNPIFVAIAVGSLILVGYLFYYIFK